METLYTTTWRNKWLTANASSIEEMATLLREAAKELDSMASDGVYLQESSAMNDDYACLSTSDSKVAEKYNMEEESDDDEFIIPHMPF